MIYEAYQSSSYSVNTLTLWLNSSLVGVAWGLHIPVSLLFVKITKWSLGGGLQSGATGRVFLPVNFIVLYRDQPWSHSLVRLSV